MQTKDSNQFFQDIINQHKGILLKVARIYCPDEEDRQDLLQEIRIQIWQSIHKYDKKYKMSTWLYRISLNVAISFYRKGLNRAKKTESLDEYTGQIAQDAEEDKEFRIELLERFISKLGEFDKALMLLYLEDKSHVEIADILGISVSNVGTKIGRIKEKLKSEFLKIKL